MEAVQHKRSFLDEALQAQQMSAATADAVEINLHKTEDYGWMLAVKRGFDLLAVLLSAPLWLPFMALLALAVKLDSRGPVFFKQVRTGLHGELFKIYKFRTMHDTISKQDTQRQSQADDRRHTRMGRLLRRSSLDELPQLLNVLAGDMSLIGPRPHARYHDQLFLQYANGYARRFRVRPGLTGWAQIHGQRGLLETQEQVQRRTDYDNAYIDGWSLRRDALILLKTVRVVIKATNAH